MSHSARSTFSSKLGSTRGGTSDAAADVFSLRSRSEATWMLSLYLGLPGDSALVLNGGDEEPEGRRGDVACDSESREDAWGKLGRP